ncbi:PEGA domain-containing protein [Pantoea agglomerans]
MRKSFFVFAVILALGLVGSTMALRYYQTDLHEVRTLQNISSVELTDSDKLLIEERNSTAKWLLGIAIGLLPGILLKKNKDGAFNLEDKILPLLIGAFLILSVYGFFLMQQSLFFILSRGPKYYLYGMYSNFPEYFQFWTLLIALVALLFYWAIPRKVVASAGILFLSVILLFLPQRQAFAQSLNDCVVEWARDRHQDMSQDDVANAINVLNKLQNRIDKNKTASCEFANVSLDQMRYSVSQSSSPNIKMAIKDTEISLTATAISPSSLLEMLINPWVGPSGLLRVKGEGTGDTVLVDDVTVGLTNLDIRLSPGKHSLIVSSGGNAIYHDDQVMIKEGESWIANF